MKHLGFLCLLAAGFSIINVAAVDDGLRHNYYDKSCPCAEEVITNMMANYTSVDQGVPARIIRMHFHDCFVRVSST